MSKIPHGSLWYPAGEEELKSAVTLKLQKFPITDSTLFCDPLFNLKFTNLLSTSWKQLGMTTVDQGAEQEACLASHIQEDG